jgi:hypothetical protein
MCVRSYNTSVSMKIRFQGSFTIGIYFCANVGTNFLRVNCKFVCVERTQSIASI